jgi:elongation factor 1-gamma
VPSFETASGFTLFESSAIAHYVAESGPKRNQLLGATPEDRARVQQWILFNDIHVEASLWDLAAWRVGIEEYSPAKEVAAEADLKRWLDLYEGHLEGRAWFVNEDDGGPSLADLTIGGTMFSLYFSYVDAGMRQSYPNLLEFFGRLKQFPELTKIYTGPMLEKRKQPEE